VGPLAVNVLSLAALLAVAAGLLASWRRTADPVAPGAPLTVERVASTLYDSAAGRPVLVVRGEVRSRAGEALPAGRVRVELVDGGRVVARTHAPVGVAPTPEQVFAVDGAAAADRLAEALAAGTPARIEPGAALPFGAVIAEPPAGAASLGVRVTPEPAP
jgi:hypothetical protein